MAQRETDFLIVGGGVAAAKAAEGIRQAGGEGSVLVITAEQELPYERPPLSKEVLRGEAGREKLRTHDEAWYREHEVEVLMGTRASALDPAAQTVTTEAGDQIRYGALLLATGAEPVRLNLPGEELDGVFYLRTVEEAERLRNAIARSEHVVVIGGGFIGAEVAASATQKGTRVSLLELAETIWTRAVGAELGRFFEEFLRSRGVHVRTRTQAERIEGRGRVEAVVLTDGTLLAADTVVIGVGVRPSTQLAEQAGLPVDNGILTDEQFQVVKGIWAAGDVARVQHPRYGRIRVEHWAEARNGGLMAGCNMAGKSERYERAPYFFSDQFDLSMSSIGWAPSWERVVVRGTMDVTNPKFVAWYLDAKEVPQAAVVVNDWDAEDAVGQVVRRNQPVSPERLADESIPFSEL